LREVHKNEKSHTTRLPLKASDRAAVLGCPGVGEGGAVRHHCLCAWI
jgi:hypothetical protein